MRMILAAAAALAASLPAAAVPLVTSKAPTPIVIGQSYVLHSRVWSADRRINVWTPPGYEAGRRRYPVLYLIDGGVEQDFHHITGLAQLGSWGTMRPFIVVGIETVDRRRELAAPALHDAKLRAQYPTAGESARFRRFISGEVKPFVESRFRADGEDTVMGESLAGLFIVETLLRSPETFDRYVAVSPSLWWDQEALSKEAAGLISRQGKGERTLWMTIGDEGPEMQSATDRLVAALKARAPASLHWTYAQRMNETHATIYHGAALNALRTLYPPIAE